MIDEQRRSPNIGHRTVVLHAKGDMRRVKIIEVSNLTTGRTVAKRVWLADTMFFRLRGLLGCQCLEADQGLLLVPCGNIHTFGMKFSIDIIHGQRDGTVCKIVTNLRPDRIGPLVVRGYFVLELPANTVKEQGIQVGHRLSLP